MPQTLYSGNNLGLSVGFAARCAAGAAAGGLLNLLGRAAFHAARAIYHLAPRRSRRARRARRATRAVRIEDLELRQLLSATYFVSTAGLDSNPGTSAKPFRTINHAAQIAQAGDTVDIFGGTYRETVTPAHSGAAGRPITFQAYNGQKVIIDGANPISNWTRYSGSIYKAPDGTDLGLGNNQVFSNGQSMVEATYPDIGLNLSNPKLATAQSGSGTSSLTSSSIGASGVNWTGGLIHVYSGQGWVSQTATITGQSGNTIRFNLVNDGDPHPGIHAGTRFYLTGKLGALRDPGQWFLSGGQLYFRAPSSGVPSNVEAKARQWGFAISGKSYINIQGVNLFACSVLANGSSNIHINNINAQYVSQFVVAPNGWQPPGNTGIVLNGNYNSLTNSTIAFSAGNGVLINGAGSSVQNCVTHDVAYSGTDTAGVYTWGSGHTVSHNTIYNSGRDGIHASGTTHVQITYNLIHDVMLQATDGGGIYTYGTDGSGSTIAYNRVFNVRSGGWGAAALYLDNGSRNYSVHNNSVTNSDIALKMNPTNYNESIFNNTLLGAMQSVASYGSEDMSGSKFVGNVFNNVTMIKGAVTMSANVRSGDTSNIPGAVGASIGGASAIVPAISTASPAPTPAPTPTPTSTHTPTPTPVPTPAPTSGAALTFQQLQALSRQESASNRRRASFSSLPAAVQRFFNMETLGTRNIAYYTFSAGGVTFYSAHYDIGSVRELSRSTNTGQLMTKLDLYGTAAATDRAQAAAGK